MNLFRSLYLTIVFVLCIAMPTIGQTLSEHVTKEVASAFLKDNRNAAMAGSNAFNGKNAKGNDADKYNIVASSQTMAIVEDANNGLFVLVAGTDSAAFVAGYGEGGESLPPLLKEMVNRQDGVITQQGGVISQQGGLATQHDGLVTQQPGAAKVKPARVSTVGHNVQWAIEDGFRLPVNRIVESVRSQSDPFNRSCPYYTYESGITTEVRSLVGCVATAAEQVLSFWKVPSALKDSIAGFDTEHNGVIPTIPAGTKIDYDNILPVYADGQYTDEQAQAVADLSYYLGVACKMDWAVGASGAQLYDLVEPLRRAFGYGYVRYLCSYDYSQRQWFRLLMKELEAGRPVVYAGYISSGGGHAFVVDGIDANGFFHVNWGYGGQYDGWFDLQVLTPQESPLEPTLEGTVMGLNHMQEALFLAPDSVEYETGDTLSWQYRLAVNDVRFLRSPDTNMYLTAEIDVSNLSEEQIYAPVQLFTYTELDSLGYPADIDYLGVADGQLRAHQDTTLTAYLSFSEAGTRLLGLSTADSMYLAFDTLQITKALQPSLNFTLQDSVVLSDAATFALKIDNLSPTYWSGRMVTYSLFEGSYTDEEGDLRHFTVLNLPPNQSQYDAVSFSDLRPQTDYTFVVRNPWFPVMQVPFTTSAPTGIHSAVADSPAGSDNSNAALTPVGANHSARPSYRLNNRITIEYNESTGRYQQVLSR